MHFYEFCNLFVIVCMASYSIGVSQQEYSDKLEKLPFCGDKGLSNQRRLLLVSTLDGRLSALNVDDGGSELWNVQTGPGAMLSSSIHRLELTNNGQWVRMIPSLSGGLYKFNGEFIEPIPVTADNLLRSSFRYSDDLVISGGKESRTYGLERETGRLLYECEMGGCENHTGLEATGDIVLVQRLTQTVRAVEPRTGLERWNFSVAQHDVKLETDPRSGCYNYDTHSTLDFKLKVIVPEGLVCAISKAQPGRVLWSHKFDAPVVSAWNLAEGQVEDVDLFGGAQPPLGTEEDPLPSSPALYIGMHQKQLYIQESVSMQYKLDLLTSSFQRHLVADERIYPQIPWHPVPVTSTAVGLPNPDPQQLASDSTNDSTNEDSNETTALSVLYASEYVNGNGFYLYMDSDQKHNATICMVNETDHNEEDTDKEDVPVIDSPDKIVVVPQIFVTSLWFWWKEVFLISVTTAVIVNILIQRRLGSHQFPTSQILFVKDTITRQVSSVPSVLNTTTPSASSLSSRSSESFDSRFLTDFVPVHCLGKGGFGVVFEARNKIDDCHYAVKRIPLPNSEESRERVMREVKALAKLEHQNIVRFFNAWIECPPPGWQQTQDQLWEVSRDIMSSNGEAFTVDLTGHVTPDSERSVGHVINRNRLKPQSIFPVPDWLSQSEAVPSKVHPAEEDDSFIVFGSPSREVSTAVSETNGDIEEMEVTDDKNDSAITMASDTSSMDTNTDVTDVDKSFSPKRPTKLKLNIEYDRKNPLTSSTMYLFIQMQLCLKKSLKDWLKDNTQTRCRSEVFNIFDQIVRAVEYVHMQGLIHRDLKPSNIFFSPDMQVKVGDFGLVTAMAESPVEMWVSVGEELDGWAEGHTARVGTQLYMSPEQVSGKPYSYKVDIYSLGVILFELLVPFNTQMERVHTLTNLRANKYPADFKVNFKEEYDLLKLMLSHRPEERPTTLGIRARPPLNCDSASSAGGEWQFELPSRRRSSTSVSKTSSHSSSLDS